MKTLRLILVAAAISSAVCRAGDVTLTVNQNASLGNIVVTDEVSISSNETARITGISYPNFGDARIQLIKNSITNSFTLSNARPADVPGVTLAGPATIRLVANGNTAFVTVQIEPQSFPPDKTIIIPQGTPGANIIMEQSTDLVSWTNSLPGSYTNTAVNHLFFRLRAERL